MVKSMVLKELHTLEETTMDKVRFLMSDTGAQITEACREALEQKGVEVTVVEKDGNKVLQKMLAVRPQVVLLDAFMPGLDALAVKQRYNAAGERHTSFFVTGAFQSEEMVQELLDEGFAYYFVKPFDESVLAARVLKAASGQEKHLLHTSVDSDELTVTEILHQIGVPAHIKGKGVAFHRRRFENDLRNYYHEEGTNEGYVVFIDLSGYYANIQHEPCKAVLHELLEKSGLSDELRLITEDLMDEIFKTFEMDVSRFSDEDIEAMMNGKVDPFMNMGVPKELLTGEKMLAKGADIGNQLAQNIGITFPYRIDNYCKIVCGMKHYGRYSDDMHIIHRSKEVLLKVLEGVKTIAAEYGLILNEKKTHICKLSGEYRYLQMKYTLLQNGVVVRRIHPKAITRERRKLKAYKRLLDKGVVSMEEIDGYFRSWLSGNYKYMSRDQIYDMNSLYVKLFGRSVTWKKGHGRLRWLMAHPSAA